MHATIKLLALLAFSSITSAKPEEPPRILPEEDLRNLELVLDLVQHSPDFQPLRVPVGYLESSGHEIAVHLTEHLAKRSIETYQLGDLTSSEITALKRSHLGLTWLIVVESHRALDEYVDLEPEIWRANSQFVIVYLGKDRGTNFSNLFATLWRKHDVYKLLIVCALDRFRHLLKYSPFERSSNAQDYGSVDRVYPNDTSDTMANNLHQTSLFEDFRDLNGYPINVTVFSSLMMNISNDQDNITTFSSADAMSLTLLWHRMNADFRINVLSVDHADPFHEGLRNLEVGASEMVITGYFVKTYRTFRCFEFTASMYEDKLCLIAPSSGPTPKYLMPFLPFTTQLWSLLFFYNALTAVLWFFMNRFVRTINDLRSTTSQQRFLDERTPSMSKNTLYRDNNDEPYLEACSDLATYLCLPLKSASTLSQRVFLFSTLLFGIVIVGLYQSRLVSSLSKPYMNPQLDSLEDVANSNLSIGTKYDNLRSNAFVENSPVNQKLRQKMKIVTSDEKTNDLIAFRKEIVALGRLSAFKLEDDSKYIDEEGNLLLHIVAECTASYRLSYVVKFLSPYLKRINALLLRTQQAGLIDKWINDMFFPIGLNEARDLSKRTRQIQLTLKHYSLTFFGLFFGLLCSTLAFFGELYLARRSKVGRRN